MAFSVTLVLRVLVEPTGFVTPDSEYYLECAQNLLAGRGYQRSDAYPIPEPRDDSIQVFFSVWPVGYPTLIAAAAFLTGFSPFWASKLLNVLILGGIFLVLRRWCGADAWKPALLFTSGSLIDVFSTTWSEVPFLLILLLFVRQLHRWERRPTLAVGGLLLLTGWGLFVFRYVGGFAFIVTGLWGVRRWWLGERRSAAGLLLVTIVGVTGALAYFAMNYYVGGTWSGGQRLYPEQETWPYFLSGLVRAVVGEWVIPKVYAANLPLVSWLRQPFLVQSVLLIWAGWRVRRRDIRPFSLRPGAMILTMWGVAAVYFVVIVAARRLSPFDPLGARMFSPATLLFGVGLLWHLAECPRLWRAVRAPVLLLFLYAYFINTPKRIVLEWVQSLFA